MPQATFFFGGQFEVAHLAQIRRCVAYSTNPNRELSGSARAHCSREKIQRVTNWAINSRLVLIAFLFLTSECEISPRRETERLWASEREGSASKYREKAHTAGRKHRTKNKKTNNWFFQISRLRQVRSPFANFYQAPWGACRGNHNFYFNFNREFATLFWSICVHKLFCAQCFWEKSNARYISWIGPIRLLDSLER